MDAKRAYVSSIRQHIDSGDFAISLSLCYQMLEQQPEKAAAYQCLGEVLEAQGNLAEAADAYVRAIELEPDLLEARAYLAGLYSQMGRLSEAIENYRQALIQRPDWAILHFNLGNALSKQGDLSGAVRSYQAATTFAPNYTKAFYNLGVALDRQGLTGEAIEAYKQVISLQPEDLDARSNLVCLLVKQKEFEPAIQILHNAISLQPDCASLHNNLGQVLIELKQTGAAIAAFGCAIQLQPDFALVHHNLGKVWQSEGYHQKAVTCFQRAIEFDPKNELLYADCSFSLMTMQDLDRAMFYLRAGLEVSPNGGRFVGSYCQEISQIGIEDEIDLARSACVKFLECLQKSATSISISADSGLSLQYLRDIYSHLGNAYFEYGDYWGAERYYRKALEIEPETAEIYTRLGDCLVQQQRFNDAAIAYGIALETQPDRPDLLFKLGKTLEQLQQFEQAIAYYRRVWLLGGAGVDEGDRIIGTDRDRIQGIYLTVKDWLAGTPYLPAPVFETPIPRPQVCGGLDCAPCLNQISRWFEPIHQGNGIYRCSHEKFMPSTALYFNPSVTHIPNGKAWIVPNENYWKVCKAIAIITADNYLLAELSRDYPGQLPVCQQHDPSQHLLFWQTALPNLEAITGKVAVLSGLSGNVYFHWMVDVLPRLEILQRQGIDWAEIDSFVVNSCQSAFQRQTLEILGIPQHKILESDRHPHIQAEQLIVPSFASHMGWLSGHGLKFLREAFLTKAMALYGGTNYPERIYISRAKAKYRKIFNEPELMDVLSQYGFISVCLESMNFLEQVTLFARAKAIVAPHGSGLTNLIFCNPGTKVVEIFSPHYIRQYFWVIGQQLNLEYYYLIGTAFRCYTLRQLMYPSPLTEDILIDLDKFQKIMELII